MENKLSLYGAYPAVVVNTQDPKGKGRVILRVASVLGSATSSWASPLGEINTPVQKGDAVLAQFIGGDVTQPLYSAANSTQPWIAEIANLQSQINAYPTAWASLSPYFRGGISAFAGTSEEYAPSWRFESANTVRFRGAIKYTSNLAHLSVVLDLTKGTPNLTPAQSVHIPVVGSHDASNASHIRVDISNADGSGLVTLDMTSAYTATWMSLEGIIYDLV